MISIQMLELGAQEKWPAKYCERKWEELHPETAGANAANGSSSTTTTTTTTTTIPTPGQQHGGLQLGTTSSAADNWMCQDRGSELEYGQSTPSIPMLSRSPITFTTPLISRSPVQRSPGPVKD